MTTYFMIRVYRKNSSGSKIYFAREFGPYLQKLHATQAMIDMNLNQFLLRHHHDKLFYEIVELFNSHSEEILIQVHDTKIEFIRIEQ